jgi:cytochrome oxidase Cu insertion factor (SCO1/SenC/PrrC family)
MNGAIVNAQSAHDRRQRRVLVGIALMFFAPLAVCFYLYYGQVGWRPGGRVNAGDLIEPPRPLPLLALPLLEGGETRSDLLRRKWTLLYAASGPCADLCQASLYHTRQVRIALDRDMNRVQRVLIADDGCCDVTFLHEQHPDLIAVRNGPEAAPLLALLPGHASSYVTGASSESSATGAAGAPSVAGASNGAGASSGGQAPRVYLIDPLGNLMMSYAAEAKPKGMLEDMKRLLRLSSIG